MFDKFAYMITMTNQKPLCEEVIKAHVMHLKKLDDQKRLIFCGPYVNEAGGIVVIHAKNLDEAEVIAQDDPFIHQGFKTYKIIEVEVAHKGNHYLI
jgi:uncharacterized protein YciI